MDKVAKTIMAVNQITESKAAKVNGIKAAHLRDSGMTMAEEINSVVSMVNPVTARVKMIGAVTSHQNNSVAAVQDNTVLKADKAVLNSEKEIGESKTSLVSGI